MRRNYLLLPLATPNELVLNYSLLTKASEAPVFAPKQRLLCQTEKGYQVEQK
jgi:hypothetical protein